MSGGMGRSVSTKDTKDTKGTKGTKGTKDFSIMTS
jgi:hypothetical protein